MPLSAAHNLIIDHVFCVQLVRFSPDELRGAFVTYKTKVKKHFDGLPNCYDDRKRSIVWGDAVPERMKSGVPAVFVVPAELLTEEVFLNHVAAIDDTAIDDALLSSDEDDQDDQDGDDGHQAMHDQQTDFEWSADDEAGPSRPRAKRSRQG